MDPIIRFIVYVGFFVAVVLVIQGVKWLRRRKGLRIGRRDV